MQKVTDSFLIPHSIPLHEFSKNIHAAPMMCFIIIYNYVKTIKAILEKSLTTFWHVIPVIRIKIFLKNLALSALLW